MIRRLWLSAALLSISLSASAAQPFGYYGVEALGTLDLQVPAVPLARPLVQEAKQPALDVRGAEADVAAVKPVLQGLYPTAPAELRAIMDQGLVFVLSRSEIAEKWGNEGVLGWAAEDDPDYRYPDKTLFPKGTIKVTLTPVMMSLAVVRGRIAKLKGLGAFKALNALDVFIGSVLVHEVTHVRQYMTGPLNHLRDEDVCGADGECDEVKLADTIKKIQYEREAFDVDFAYETAAKPETAMLSAILNTNPDVLRDVPEPHKMLLTYVAQKARTEPMSNGQRLAYESAYEGILMARGYKTLIPAVSGAKDRAEGLEAAKKLRTTQAKYKEYDAFFTASEMDPSSLYGYTKKIWPRLKERSGEAAGALKAFEARFGPIGAAEAAREPFAMGVGELIPLL